MPIGDLLAQISGGDAPASTPRPTISRANTLPKRRADDDLSNNVSKTPRTTLSSTVAPRPSESLPQPRYTGTSTPSARPAALPSRPLDRPSSSQRPVNGSNAKPSVLSSKPMNGANRVKKPSAPGRPSPGPSNVSRVAPKKGSFAEILARGQRAQQVMGQVGRIQHKKVEKGAVKKETPEPRVDPRHTKKKQPPQSGYAGTGKPVPRTGTSANGHARDGRNGKGAPPAKGGQGAKTDRARAAAEEEREKKFKKAAAATTGYTGTARPKPGGAVKQRDAPRGGALLNTRAPRPTSSKSRFNDDYDEELDDFIDYDDEEEEQGGPRYDYASDESSDMEAGLEDIDTEERRAEIIARREDIAEEQLEKNLKARKEARKREALEALRRNRR
ncbi:Fc.00g078110.m01.CDS01 [Cosmosporella sp. VM-42]